MELIKIKIIKRTLIDPLVSVILLLLHQVLEILGRLPLAAYIAFLGASEVAGQVEEAGLGAVEPEDADEAERKKAPT